MAGVGGGAGGGGGGGAGGLWRVWVSLEDSMVSGYDGVWTCGCPVG